MHTYQDMLIKRQFIFEVLVSGFSRILQGTDAQAHRQHEGASGVCEQHDVWPD
jgi:hypothetical protein